MGIFRTKHATLIFKDIEAAASVVRSVRSNLNRDAETQKWVSKVKLTDGRKKVQFPHEPRVFSAVSSTLQRSNAVKALLKVEGCKKTDIGLN